MFPRKTLLIASLLLSGFAFSESEAQARGSYSAFSYSSARGYGFRTYSYTSQTTRTTHTHIAVYLPRQPRYVYYFNTQTRQYWGRYDQQTGKYQILPEHYRKEQLSDIPESSFLPPAALPPEGDGSLETLLPPPEAPKPNRPICSTTSTSAGCR